MQFKTFFTIASLAALAAASPGAKRADEATLTSQFTTQTFTATRVLQSLQTKAPFVTTITTNTVWTVAQTVVRPVPTDASQA